MAIDNETINLIFKMVLSLVGILVTSVFVPWLKNKLGEQKYTQLQEYADLAVRTAEMIFSIEEYARKKEYAIDYVTEKANEIGLNVTPEDINVLVESAVEFVKYGSTFTKGSE